MTIGVYGFFLSGPSDFDPAQVRKAELRLAETCTRFPRGNGLQGELAHVREVLAIEEDDEAATLWVLRHPHGEELVRRFVENWRGAPTPTCVVRRERQFISETTLCVCGFYDVDGHGEDQVAPFYLLARGLHALHVLDFLEIES